MIFSRKDKEVDKAFEEMGLEEGENPDMPPLEPAHYGAPKRESAPLFVKLDKYKDILSTVDEMKKFVTGIKQTFALLHELEEVKRDSLNIIRTTVQHLEKNLIEMDAEMLRPGMVDMKIEEDEREIGHVEDSVKDLQAQLATLRRELEDLR